MQELVAAINDVAIEHPEVRGITVRTWPIKEGIYAYATSRLIVINRRYTGDPTTINRMIDYDISEDYHPPLGRCTGVQFLAYHEAAHIIDRGKQQIPRQLVMVRFGSAEWLRPWLSGYSYTSAGMHHAEALAEAFAAVRCNGGNWVEQQLNGLLVG